MLIFKYKHPNKSKKKECTITPIRTYNIPPSLQNGSKKVPTLVTLPSEVTVIKSKIVSGISTLVMPIIFNSLYIGLNILIGSPVYISSPISSFK